MRILSVGSVSNICDKTCIAYLLLLQLLLRKLAVFIKVRYMLPAIGSILDLNTTLETQQMWMHARGCMFFAFCCFCKVSGSHVMLTKWLMLVMEQVISVSDDRFRSFIFLV